jgi:hypothetical protein
MLTPIPKRKKLPKQKRPMTIAIGMLCKGGVIVAADTQLTWPDGRTEYGPKVHEFSTKTGTFVIAIATSDIEAASPFISNVKRDLDKPIKSLLGVENAIKETMKKWSSFFHFREDRNDISFILAAQIKDHAPEDKDTTGLFLCQLPMTVSRKTFDNAKGYVAIGCAKPATDPLFNVLFGGNVPASPRTSLGRASYLLYRAKKDFRGGCGGDTDAVFLSEDGRAFWIEQLSMTIAESHGEHVDELLGKTASLIISEEWFDSVQWISKHAFDLEGKALSFRRLEFNAKNGELIE